METLLRIGLSNAVAALLLALVVVTVACIWRRPAVLHALWLLVLIKLVTPPLVWLPDPWTAPAAPSPPTAVTPLQIVMVEPPADPSAQETAVAPPAGPIPNEVVEAPAVSEPAPIPAAAAPEPGAPWWVVAACGVWLSGALAWYALAVSRLRRFRRLLRHARPAPESLRQRTQRLAEKLRLRRCPAVWLAPGRVAPMLWAAGGRPRILLPAELLERIGVEQQNALIVHELAHLRRRDHWVRWLEFVAAGLHWWNPVLWLARRELREAEELCCDAWVTSTLPGAAREYATALLETLDFLSDAPPAQPLLASGVGRVSDLKRRLTMIMRGTTPRSLSWRGLTAVVGLGALLLPLLPAWVRAEPPTKTTEEPKKEDAVILRFNGDFKLDDGDNVKEELKRLEDQLAQKQTEVAALTAKVQELRAKLAKAAPTEQPRRIVVAVDGNSNYASLQDLLKKLQANPPAPEFVVIDEGSGKIILKSEGARPTAAPPAPNLVWKVVPQPAAAADPNTGFLWRVAPPPAPAADPNKRIDELEAELKKILQEVDQLRKERKPGAPEGRGDPNPMPTEKLSYIGGLFVNPNAAEDRAKELAAEREVFLKQLDELKAKSAAEDAAAARMRQDLQSKVEQLEKELQKAKDAAPTAAPQKR